MFHADELSDAAGRWTKGSLEKFGVTMRSAGRREGMPHQAVMYNGERIGGTIRRPNGSFSAYHISHGKIVTDGHGSIAEAAAHLAAHHVSGSADTAPNARRADSMVEGKLRKPSSSEMKRGAEAGAAARKLQADLKAKGGSQGGLQASREPSKTGFAAKFGGHIAEAHKHIDTALSYHRSGQREGVEVNADSARKSVASAMNLLPPGHSATPHLSQAFHALGDAYLGEGHVDQHLKRAKRHLTDATTKGMDAGVARKATVEKKAAARERRTEQAANRAARNLRGRQKGPSPENRDALSALDRQMAAMQDFERKAKAILGEQRVANAEKRRAAKVDVEARIDEQGMLKLSDHPRGASIRAKLKRGNTVKLRGRQGEWVISSRIGNAIRARPVDGKPLARVRQQDPYDPREVNVELGAVTHVRMSRRYNRPGGGL